MAIKFQTRDAFRYRPNKNTTEGNRQFISVKFSKVCLLDKGFHMRNPLSTLSLLMDKMASLLHVISVSKNARKICLFFGALSGSYRVTIECEI